MCSTIQTQTTAITGSEQVSSCCSGNINHWHLCPPLRYHSSSLPQHPASLVQDPNLISACTSPLLLSHKGPITGLSCCVRSQKEKSSLDFSCTWVHVKLEEKNNNETFTNFIQGCPGSWSTSCSFCKFLICWSDGSASCTRKTIVLKIWKQELHAQLLFIKFNCSH